MSCGVSSHLERGFTSYWRVFRHEIAIRDLYRRRGIRPNVYYVWIKEFVEAGKGRLAQDNRS